MDSILTSIKLALGIEEDVIDFDNELIMHINSVLMVLRQLGVGPDKSFRIEDDGATWEDFLGDEEPEIELIKTYVYSKVRLIFDPPANSALITLLERNIHEAEWRLNFDAECKIQNGGED